MISTFARWSLSGVLIIAGFLHLLVPELFNPAIPFSFKYECNLLAGVLELTLGVGLFFQKTKEICAKVTALWFLLLIPIHVYVSLSETPIFGVSSPWLLWLRTFFQPILYLWALSLQEKGWIISQRWSDVLFLHFEVNAEKLQAIVPYPLDLFQGKALVSIVPFKMSHIRFPFLPPLPGLSYLKECNLRTYVNVDGQPLVYFLTLDANHFLGVWVAKIFFKLPYRYQKMRYQRRGHNELFFTHDKLSLTCLIDREEKSLVSSEEGKTDKDLKTWASERYGLVTKNFWGFDLKGDVEHKPWPLQQAVLQELKDNWSREYIELGQFLGASYADQMDVRFRPFSFLSNSKGRKHERS